MQIIKNPLIKKIYGKINYYIKNNNTFFIAGHRRPDGDSIAVQLVLASILKRLNKKYEIYSSDPVPGNLKFLPGISQIKCRKRVIKNYDVAFIVECSGQDRMGNIIDLKKQADYVINIDHHSHFNQFGDVNLINPKASSSCEQIHGLFKVMNMKLRYDEALCLYVGILTDTGCFRHANTSSYAHYLASQYLAMGVNTEQAYRNIYQQKSFTDMRFLGKMLCNLEVFSKGRIAVIDLPEVPCDTEDLINYGMMMSRVLVTVLFQSVDKYRTRVSFRSRDSIDVGRLAFRLGGGGHVRAAGCTVNESFKSARTKVLRELKKIVGNL